MRASLNYMMQLCTNRTPNNIGSKIYIILCVYVTIYVELVHRPIYGAAIRIHILHI